MYIDKEYIQLIVSCIYLKFNNHQLCINKEILLLRKKKKININIIKKSIIIIIIYNILSVDIGKQ